MTVLFWNIESVSTYKFFMGIMSILKDIATHFCLWANLMIEASTVEKKSFHSEIKERET